MDGFECFRSISIHLFLNCGQGLWTSVDNLLDNFTYPTNGVESSESYPQKLEKEVEKESFE